MPERTARRLCGPIMLGLALSAGGAVHASTIQPMSDVQMAQDAGFIVHGDVINVQSAWNQDFTQIYTYVDVAINRQLKGAPLGDLLQMRVMGGAVDGIGMAVIDAPQFQPDEEVILYLGPNPQTFFPVVGMSQGKLNVVLAGGRR